MDPNEMKARTCNPESKSQDPTANSQLPPEALRCLACADAPCHAGCPAGVNPREFIRKIRFGNMAGAARSLRSANILMGSCAYICPCGTTCGGRCTSEKLGRPIDIVGLQRFVADWERTAGLPIVLSGAGNPKSGIRNPESEVAVVGAGPAGLAAAAGLAFRGRRVVVFDRAGAAGGMLRSAIPRFRLPEDVLDFDVSLVERLGVELRMGTEVSGPDDLFRDGFGAVFVATGVHGSRPLGIPGESLRGVVGALELLVRANAGAAPEPGRRFAVIGGGDVAIDAARTLRRSGARVTVAYRRSRADMPAYAPEVAAAFAEGIEFLFDVLPVKVKGRGRVSGLVLQRVRWEAGGRRAVRRDLDGAPFAIDLDGVVVATGQENRTSFGLETTPQGWIRTDPETGMTSRDGVFAGGDVVLGPATAVAAVGQGRAAAERIDAWLRSHAPADSASRQEPHSAFSPYPPPRADLSIDFCGVRFANPFVLAAAPPTDDLDMVRDAFRLGWAGAVLKTTSVEGTPVPLAYPMMSSLEIDGRRVSGLGNIDLISEHHVDVVERRVGALKEEFPDRVVVASIMGARKEDWQSLVRRLEAAGADMIECSFSCPQGTLGSRPGAMLGQDVEASRTVAGWVKEAARRIPVVIKLTPQVADVVETARAVLDAGADGVCASNTIPSLMGIDLRSFVPEPDVGGKSSYSGLSGPAIKPITLRCIAEIARRTGAQITGTGGPITAGDAAELMLVGARTVQFCTAVMHHGADIICDLVEGLGDYLDGIGVGAARDLVGRALPNVIGHDELPRGARVRSRIDPGLCIGCGVCFIACRDGGHRAIRVGDYRIASVDDERCVGCGLCRLVCPVAGCVTMRIAGRPVPAAP